jgi:type I restriction enzyme R subunit
VALLRHSDLAKAFFGTLKDQVPAGEVALSAAEDPGSYDGQVRASAPAAALPDLLASVACEIEKIVRNHSVVRWRDNPDAQNRMRNELDDLLFNLKRENGVDLSLTQMDAIIESILRIARNRQDV